MPDRPMNITLKLYASLAKHLPDDAERNIVAVEIDADTSVHQVIERFRVPRASAHLVLVNGYYIEPENRDEAIFKEGDVLAVWPPVAGG